MIFCPDGIIPNSGLTGLNNTYIYIYIYIYITLYINILHNDVTMLLKIVTGRQKAGFTSFYIYIYI